MDVEDLYDEFGNYIGPDEADSDSNSDSLQLPGEAHETDASSKHVVPKETPDESRIVKAAADTQQTETSAIDSQAIILPDEKQYYPSAEDIFGPKTEVLIEEEDAQQIFEPVVAPSVEPSSGLHERLDSIPAAKYSRGYLTSAILPNAALIRNVAIVGHLHHGKTSFVDMLFDSTHCMPWSNLDDRDIPVRYMDTRQDEQDLHISIKTTAATFLMQTSMEKSFGVTLFDTPGHLDFLDEAIAAMTMTDGVVVLVDAAEGVMIGTETILRRAAAMQMDIVLVISKLDRLCLELRLPPQDAYHKIRHIIETVNEIIAPFDGKKLSPAYGNVAFAASNQRVCFTLQQFARQYIATSGGPEKFPMNARDLARRFWGDFYYDPSVRRFTKESGGGNRTFVTFVLEPFYKLHTAVVSKDIDELTQFLDRNVLLEKSRGWPTKTRAGTVKRKSLGKDIRTMLKEVNSNVFGMGHLTGFTEMIVDHVRSPEEAIASKLNILGNTSGRGIGLSEDVGDGLATSGPEHSDANNMTTPLMAYVGKLIPDEKGESFDCLARVMRGKLRRNEQVFVLGNAYDVKTNKEDHTVATVTALFFPCGRFKLETHEASEGQIVLVRGIHYSIFKSATIVSKNNSANPNAFPLRSVESFLPAAVAKVSVEPVKPSELPKMIAALRKCVNIFPGLITKVEDTGEHTLTGSGELYMDCALRDLREAYETVDIKVSDPVVPFSETVSETSALQCYADTPNKQNKFVMIAEPLEENILTSLDNGLLERSEGERADLLRENGWDALAVKSLWTFGPDTSKGPNALLNDILIQDSRRRVEDVRESIVQGFAWATREGPLADEPVRAVKLRLLDASIAKNSSDRSPAQVIPTCRRVVYSSILTGNPRLMEPIYRCEILCRPESMNAAYMLVGRRRGTVISEADVAGTPLKRAMVHIPVLDSFGFEADLRSLTHGDAFCMQLFDHWDVIPGDPLDKSVELRPLEPAGRRELARECMVKTRRRKGMPDEVSITKYFDDPLLVELAADNPELRQLL